MSTQPQLSLIRSTEPAWVTAEEAMKITGWGETWLRREVLAGRVYAKESTQRSRNGRATKLYLAASLPNCLGLVIGSKPTELQQSLPLFAPAPKASELRVVLTDPEEQKRAEQRLNILRPILDYAADPKRFAIFRLEDGSPVTSETRLILYLAQVNRVPETTIRRWKKDFETGGFAALGRKPRSDKGVSAWADQSPLHSELRDLAAYGYLHEHLHKKMCWEIVDCRAKQLGIVSPSYETIRTVLENIPPAVRTLALEGRRKYDEIFAPYIRRGYEDFEANEIWVSDHALHDVLVQNDLFDAKTREHMRLRFTGIIDMRSRKVLGYAWSQEGSSRSITVCLGYVVRTYGAGRLFYCDNGKDYQRVGKGARTAAWKLEELPPELLGVIARLQMEVGYCIPFHPQSKLIERYNNTMHQRFDRRFLTYCGPSPDKRPDRCIAALERHEKLLTQGRADESDLPLASEFIGAASQWIEQEYNTRTKDVLGMKGLTPNEAFEQHRWSQQQPPPEPHVLACLLAERVQRCIHEGAIELLNRRYVGVDDVSRRALHDRSTTKRDKQKYTVAFDYPDADYLAAMDEDGYVFAYLEPETLLRHSKDDETQQAIGDSMRERSHRYKETRGQLNDLQKRVLTTGYVTQNDQMLQIGRLPIEINQFIVHRPATHKLQPEITTSPATPAQAARKLLEDLKNGRSN